MPPLAVFVESSEGRETLESSTNGKPEKFGVAKSKCHDGTLGE